MKDCDLITLLSVFVLLSLIGAIATKMSEINDILPGFSADVFLTESFVAPVGAPGHLATCLMARRPRLHARHRVV